MSSPPYTPAKPAFGRIPPPNGFLVVNHDSSPMVTHGSGALASLIKSRSTTSLHSPARRRPSSVKGTHHDVEDPPPFDLVGRDSTDLEDGEDFRHTMAEERRLSAILMGPQMRSQRLIGNSNPRYKWERYWKTEEELGAMKPALREYYERTNSLVQQYLHIDRILDSTTPHNLINEYDNIPSSGYSSSAALRDIVDVPDTISEEPASAPRTPGSDGEASTSPPTPSVIVTKVNRTPRGIYKVSERTPLLLDGNAIEEDEEEDDGLKPEIPELEDDSVESGDRIVQIAIYVNLAANTILLLGKIGVMVLTSSLSVLASLVDAALDFLSTGIIWTTTRLIERQDQYQYPIGRRRLEPVGVLVFSIIMITAFCQVGIECITRLNSGDHAIIELTLPAIIIMCSTVLVKGLCWLWCRLIKNSSVQALAQDAMTDIIFNIFSIIFPLVGFYAGLWWMDALGGLLLSLFVIFNWAGTSAGHIRNLTGAASTADERNVLLYLTMRFAKTIKQIQGLKAYHSGDKLNVEVDIVLDENTSLRDSHDLGESLQYVLESVPNVDRAFVHQDYAGYNLPTHMQQQGT